MACNSLKRKPKGQIWKNGFRIPPKYDPVKFEDSLTYIAEPGDIFICTYPKCGTTWTQCILYLMLNKGDPIKQGQHICSVIPHLEDDGKDAVSNISKPRIIKTHLPYHMLPKNRNAKYIVIARNPKDCCVSFFHHTKGFTAYDFADGKFEDYFDLFIAGEVDFGDYFDNILSYLPHKDDPNVLFLLYEDMKSDVRECIRKIGAFLGEPFQESSENPAILEKVLQNCAFKAMKATPSSWSSERVKGSSGFIRKGEVGDWKNHFTDDQVKRMDEKFKEKLGGTAAEHFWDEYDC